MPDIARYLSSIIWIHTYCDSVLHPLNNPHFTTLHPSFIFHVPPLVFVPNTEEHTVPLSVCRDLLDALHHLLFSYSLNLQCLIKCINYFFCHLLLFSYLIPLCVSLTPSDLLSLSLWHVTLTRVSMIGSMWWFDINSWVNIGITPETVERQPYWHVLPIWALNPSVLSEIWVCCLHSLSLKLPRCGCSPPGCTVTVQSKLQMNLRTSETIFSGCQGMWELSCRVCCHRQIW